MKLCFSTLGCPDWDVWHVATKAKEYGFDAVELRISGDRHVDTALTKHERHAIAEHFQQHGIEILCLGGYTRWNQDNVAYIENMKQSMRENIDLAVDLGAKYIRTFIGQYPPEVKEETVVQIAAQSLNECGLIAEQKGVQILIETHDAFGTAQKVNQIIKNIQSNGVAVLWDIEHTMVRGETMQETYALLGDKIKHLHIKDVRLKNDETNTTGMPTDTSVIPTDTSGTLTYTSGTQTYTSGTPTYTSCMPGEGILPLAETIHFMKANGFSGAYSLEWEKTWNAELAEPEEIFPKYISYIKSL